jgi:putative membrane protein
MQASASADFEPGKGGAGRLFFELEEDHSMRILMWVLRILLFFLLFGFAVKNDHSVDVFFFFGSDWTLPLVFVILAAFAAGAILGVTATFASLLGKRREISRLRRELSRAERDRDAATGKAT